MSDRISPLKLMFDGLYWSAATTYDGVQPTAVGTYGSTTAVIESGGKSTNWTGKLTIESGATFSGAPNNYLTSGRIYARFYNQQEVDLIGNFSQGKVMQPLGISTQKTEPYAMAEFRDADLYVREFVVWTTQKMSDLDLENLASSLTPTPPYYDGNMHPEQVIAGYSQTYTQNLQNVGPVVGFVTPIQRDNLGFMDTIAAPKLYCTKIVVVSGTIRNGSTGISLYIDIPFSAEVMSAVEQEPDELEFFTGMARSLQPPE